jgi:hypothetical protein
MPANGEIVSIGTRLVYFLLPFASFFSLADRLDATNVLLARYPAQGQGRGKERREKRLDTLLQCIDHCSTLVSRSHSDTTRGGSMMSRLKWKIEN